MPKSNDDPRKDEARRRTLRNAVRPGPATPAGWRSASVPLPATHKWKCSPGHNLLVADRGAVRFEYPEGWHIAPGKHGELGVHDTPSPDDECRIQLSIIRTPGVSPRDFAALSLVELLRQAVAGDDAEKPRSRGWTVLTDVSTIERPDLRIAWIESSWLDVEHGGRKVLCRQLVTRSPGAHPFITFDYYEDRAADFRPVWLHMVETLRIATPINLLGETLN